MPTLTDQVKAVASELGGDMVGIAPIARFANAPLRMSPQGLLPGAQSVIVVGIHHLDAMIELDGEPTSQDYGPYGLQSSYMNARLDDISFLMARFLEAEGHRTLPISASNIWRYHGYKDLQVCFAPDMAHRYAAAAAGLGEIGWNGLLLSPEYGPRNRFVSIVTEAKLEPTPMYDGEPLCDRCLACVDNCPTDAFRQEVKRINEIEIGSRTFRFPETNKWRCAWAENFNLNLQHDIPEKVDESVIREYMEKYGPRHGEMGSCLRFCMTPQRRYYDEDYCRAPRRKKAPATASPEALLAEIQAIYGRDVIDVMAVADASAFADYGLVNPEYHLPGVASVICIGIRRPPATAGNPYVDYLGRRRLTFASFRMAHVLDMAGYEAITQTKIADNLVAKRLGIYGGDVQFSTILSSLALPTTKLKRAAAAEPTLDPETLRQFCLSAGVDMVGYFGKARYDGFAAALQDTDLVPKEAVQVIDRSSATSYHPFIPVVHQHKIALKHLDDWLPNARSVIVLGLHYPDASLDNAKVTPAETVGPYAFAGYESFRLLQDAAYLILKKLNDCGYRANYTFDLTGLGGLIRGCRGMLPDMRANVYAAVLSGLAYQGVHGSPITADYGVRQRFLAIVTDLELPDDPFCQERPMCEGCSTPCVEGCPTGALAGTATSITVGGQSLKLFSFDTYACDWAKRYALAGKEGAKYHGLDVDFPVPERHDTESLVEALSTAEWGVQKRLLNICEECLRVCPAHS
jgi:epoxyqueuosine reductase QueG